MTFFFDSESRNVIKSCVLAPQLFHMFRSIIMMCDEAASDKTNTSIIETRTSMEIFRTTNTLDTKNVHCTHVVLFE